MRWGILGGGNISRQFAQAVELLPDAEVYAVASLSGKKDIAASVYYSDYESLAGDDKVDAVYIGTLNTQHFACAETCLRAGKPVLCEKPFTMNAAECEQLISLAKENGAFLMEAMWTRWIPANRELTRICRTGQYGGVQYIQSSFGRVFPPEAQRVFRAELGGSALLDLGVYGISYCNMLLGEHPVRICSAASLTAECVDTDISVRLEYPGGAVADLAFSLTRRQRNEMFVATEQADFSVPSFWRPEIFYRYAPNDAFVQPVPAETCSYPIAGNGYGYEAQEVARCLREGLAESPQMPHADTLAIMRTMDEIRAQCGIVG